MKKVILGLALFLGASGTAFANCAAIDKIGGLDKATKQEMKVQCEQKKLEIVNKATGAVDDSGVIGKITDPALLTEWGQVSQEFAKALGIAAKELGIATNEFLGTPAGKLTAALIVWHVAGESILGVVVGIPLAIAIMWIGVGFLRKTSIKEIKYKDERHWWGTRIVDTVKHKDFCEDRTWLTIASCAFMFIGVWAVLANIVF